MPHISNTTKFSNNILCPQYTVMNMSHYYDSGNHNLDPIYIKITPFTYHQYKLEPKKKEPLLHFVVGRLEQLERSKGLKGIS